MKTDRYGFPVKQGLYDPQLEKDACGVGFVVNIDGIPSHKVSKSKKIRLTVLQIIYKHKFNIYLDLYLNH